MSDSAGVCGLNGMSYNLNGDENSVTLDVKGSHETWGRAGIYVEGSSGSVNTLEQWYVGGSSDSWGWTQKTYDLSSYGSGARLVIGNYETDSNCNNGDHGFTMRADSLSFGQ